MSVHDMFGGFSCPPHFSNPSSKKKIWRTPKSVLCQVQAELFPSVFGTNPQCPPHQRVAQPRKQPTVTSPENGVAAS